MPITFSHPHIRIRDIAETLDFYCDKLGLVETTRNTQGKLTLIYLAAPADMDRADGAPPATLELAHVEGAPEITDGSRFAHIAFYVDDLVATCARLGAGGVTISVQPQPRGYAYVVSPDGLTIELLQRPVAP
jgi:lactoylglutathione lyase